MTQKGKKPTAALEKWGWASIGVNVILTALNLSIAYASGSLAVVAEIVHNLADLMASVAVLAGLRLSQRKSHKFPYGLYKVENVVAAIFSHIPLGHFFCLMCTSYSSRK
jgi:divalent metal cation (Fe/Co/Zn/Cd) transporter